MGTKLVGLGVKFYICIRDVHSSNFGQDTGYQDSDFAWLSSVVPDNCEIVPQLGQDRFLQNPSQFIIHLSF
jgi:hypothetical protein